MNKYMKTLRWTLSIALLNLIPTFCTGQEWRGGFGNDTEHPIPFFIQTTTLKPTTSLYGGLNLTPITSSLKYDAFCIHELRGLSTSFNFNRELSFRGGLVQGFLRYDQERNSSLWWWGVLSYKPSSQLSSQFLAMYQTSPINGSLYTLVGGVDCKMGRWTLQGSIQYNQSQWMGLISQRTFVSPGVEYSITDKLSIQSTMHLPLYNSGAPLGVANTSISKYQLTPQTYVFVGTETYVNPRTGEIIVNPTGGVHSTLK